MDKPKNYMRPIFLLLLLLSFFSIAAVLKLTSSVLIPITIAVFLGLIFEPIVKRISVRLKLPRVISIAIVFLFLAIAISAISSILFASLKTILNVYPKYEERFIYIYKNVAKFFSLSYDEDNSLFSNLWGQLEIRKVVQGFVFDFSSSLIGFSKNFVMILLFAFFFLLELKNLHAKINHAVSLTPSPLSDSESSPKQRVSNIINSIIEQVAKYISTKFFISLLTGVIVYLGILPVKLDFPILWAFLAFLLNFIPTFGSIISVGLTSIFSLLQFWPSPVPVIYIFVFMTLTNFIIGNILEPKIQGKNLGLSPFVIIVSLSVWGWIWGFAGLVLGVPMMVIVKIICENFSLLQPISVLLGSKVPDDSDNDAVVKEDGADTKTDETSGKKTNSAEDEDE